jgi:hypothetical protein
MALFNKSAIAKLEGDLASLRKRAAALNVKASDQQLVLDRAVADRQAYLVASEEIDDAMVEKLQRACDSAESKLAGMRDAVAVLQKQIASAESVLTAEQDKIARAAASEKLSREVEQIAAMLPEWLAVTREFHDALKATDAQTFEVEQLASFLVNTTASQVEIATSFIIGELRGLAESVKTGHAPIPRPRVEPVAAEIVPFVDPIKPEEDSALVFTLKHIAYRNLAGRRIVVPQFTDHDLPRRLHARHAKAGSCQSQSSQTKDREGNFQRTVSDQQPR